MSHVFISYARSTAREAQAVAAALRGLGHEVWLDDEIPAHRAYGEVIEERLRAAKAVVVIWSAEAVKSQWVFSEANRAREDGKLVQLTVDTTRLPMPFDTIQFADMTGWSGELNSPGWRKVAASVADLVGGTVVSPSPLAASPLALPSKPSIAVMPFANLSGDPEQEYFVDGMVEEIVAALTRFRSLFVVGSGSSLSFKGQAISPQDAARKLGVRYVLEGSVRKAGGRVRIAVKLTDAADGSQIWADRFEDTLEDVFALQDRVALGVAGVIEPAISNAEVRRAAKRPTDNMGSYDLCLRAVPLYHSYAKSDMLDALALLNRAIALDPDYGQALVWAASCHLMIARFEWLGDPEPNRREGISLAHRALKVAGDDAQVVALAAFALHELEGDLDAATSLTDRAIALNPGSSVVWELSANVRSGAGDADVAIEHLETAIRLDPMGPNRTGNMFLMGGVRFQQGRFSEAVALMKEYAQQRSSPTVQAYLASSYGHLGRMSEARDALARYGERTSVPIDRLIEKAPPHHRPLLRDGIAMAEGKISPDAPTGG